MTRTLPEIGSKVQLASKAEDGHIGQIPAPDGEVEMLGPSGCGTEGRIGVKNAGGGIDVIHHVDDLPTGAIGWTD